MKKKQTSPQLLSAYRNLSISAIYGLSDAETLILLKNARWGNSHCFYTVECPRCQITHKAYFLSSRKQWQCKHCQYRFSIKSGTIFQNAKLSLKSYWKLFTILRLKVREFLPLSFPTTLTCNIKPRGRYCINSVKPLKRHKTLHLSQASFISTAVM